ncbi:MAG: hypothetical protein ABIR15_18700 [Chitinophagaceae bacterium]
MPAPTFSQLQSESATWKRLLSFWMDENIHLKNRMSEILKGDCNVLLLAKLEAFQTNFIYTDTLIAVLRNDVLDFEKKLELDDTDEQLVNKNISGRLQRMRRNISAAERTFNKRQAAFNDYLSENI